MSKIIHNELKTKRLILGSYKESDLNQVKKGLSDIELCKNIGADPIYDISLVKTYITDNIITFKSEKCRNTRLAVRLKNGLYIGNIGVYKKDNIELGWWMLKDYRRYGYMSEALIQLIKVLKVYNIDIVANIYNFNTNSQMLAKHIGMEPIEYKDNYTIYCVKEG